MKNASVGSPQFNNHKFPTESSVSCTVKFIQFNGYPLKGNIIRVIKNVKFNPESVSLETREELQPIPENTVFTCNEFLSSNLRYIWSIFPALELDFLPIEVTVFDSVNGQVFDQERKWLPVSLSPDELDKDIFTDDSRKSFTSYLKKKTTVSAEVSTDSATDTAAESAAELEYGQNSTVREYINAPDSSWSVQSRAKLIWVKSRSKKSRNIDRNEKVVKITKDSRNKILNV